MVEKVRYYCLKLLADPSETIRIRADRAEKKAGRMGSTVKLYLDDECVGKLENVSAWWIEDEDVPA